MNSSQRIEENSKILQSIAERFPKSSEEYEALKTSALAFIFVILRHEGEFDDYTKNLHSPLSIDELKRMRPGAVRREDSK